jgi:hypothetical protein
VITVVALRFDALFLDQRIFHQSQTAMMARWAGPRRRQFLCEPVSFPELAIDGHLLRLLAVDSTIMTRNADGPSAAKK